MIDIPVPVVLASSSPTRRRLLRRLLEEFQVVPADVDESIAGGGEARRRAREAAVKLARRKARCVARRQPEALVIGADTLVRCGDEIIGKPADRADAVRILELLTRGGHEVVTGLCVVSPDARERSSCACTRIRLRPMSTEEIQDYVDRPGALRRAGVYALQPNDPNVEWMEGGATTVMGLPLPELCRLLRELYPDSVPEDGSEDEPAQFQLDNRG